VAERLTGFPGDVRIGPMPFLILFAVLSATDAVGQAALKYDAPRGWTTRQAASSMRVAEFVLPRAQGDAEDAELIVYFFGGQGGAVQANIDRWIGQMSQPDGRPSSAVAKTSTTQSRSGLKVTLVDVSGTYVAETMPGGGARHNKPNFRLRAAIVDTPRGPYFVKLTGPAPTVARWDDAFRGFVASLRVE
jgi:hypothetical protein